MNDTKTNNLMIPLSIIIAGGLIAFAIFLGNEGKISNVASDDAQPKDSTKLVKPLTKEDHIMGNPDAPVKIVEYSDFECPFCKRFHNTMNKIMDEYGESGQVAWIYRQFPLDQLHPKKARLEALTSECIAEIGGNDAFWQFANKFFAVTPSNNQTDIDVVLPQIIKEMGLSPAEINKCVASGKYDQHVQDDIDNAIATGGRGTPWSIVISPNGETFPLSGAQPYDSVKQLIDISLKNK